MTEDLHAIVIVAPNDRSTSDEKILGTLTPMTITYDSVSRKKVLMDQIDHFGFSPVFASTGPTS